MTKYAYKSNMWKEVPEESDPFVARSVYCHGYDVARQILPKAGFFEYLFLMYTGQRPKAWQAQLLEKLAIALANAGPKSEAIRAAMNSGAVKCAPASSLIAALGVNSGLLCGSQEVLLLMQAFANYGSDLEQWLQFMAHPNREYSADVWPEIEHRPGYRPMTHVTSSVILDTLQYLSQIAGTESCLNWLCTHQSKFETADQHLQMSFVAAAAFKDLGLNPNQSAMLYLLLCLPGAGAHSLDSAEIGFRNFPLFMSAVELDPEYDLKEVRPLPDISEFNL